MRSILARNACSVGSRHVSRSVSGSRRGRGRPARSRSPRRSTGRVGRDRGRTRHAAIETLLDYVERYRVVTDRAGIEFRPGPDRRRRAAGGFGDDRLRRARRDRRARAPPRSASRKRSGSPRSSARRGTCSTTSSPEHPPSSARGHEAAGGTATRWCNTSSRPSSRTPASSGSTSRSSAPISAATSSPRSGQRPTDTAWPVRYAARRIAWHVLDHAWEIEDRSEARDPAGVAARAALLQAGDGDRAGHRRVHVAVERERARLGERELERAAAVDDSGVERSVVGGPRVGALSSLRTTTVVPTGTVRSSLNANPEITISAPRRRRRRPGPRSPACVASLSDGRSHLARHRWCRPGDWWPRRPQVRSLPRRTTLCRRHHTQRGGARWPRQRRGIDVSCSRSNSTFRTGLRFARDRREGDGGGRSDVERVDVGRDRDPDLGRGRIQRGCGSDRVLRHPAGAPAGPAPAASRDRSRLGRGVSAHTSKPASRIVSSPAFQFVALATGRNRISPMLTRTVRR